MNGWEVQTNAGSDAAITKVAQLEDSNDYNCIVDDNAGNRVESDKKTSTWSFYMLGALSGAEALLSSA